MNRRLAVRAPLLALAMASLLAALWTGLLRLGWRMPVPSAAMPNLHGPLMVVGFLGTLVSLERAVALGRWWTYGAPLLLASGALAALFGVAGAGPAGAAAAGALVLVLVFAEILRRQPTLFNAVMACGAVALLVGNLQWARTRPFFDSAYWWAGFLVLTIVGERLELSRLLRITRPRLAAFLLAVLTYAAGLCLGALDFGAGVRLAGAGLLGLALWLLAFDIARRTVRTAGLTRFVAVCLLLGYGWMAISGALALAFGGATAGVQYDAILHSLFLGFVFSMIFGHAPIIFPAVLGFPMAFRKAFYTHLAVLHASLALRVAGDLASSAPARQWGGLLAVAAILLFLVNTVLAVRAGAQPGGAAA